MENHDKIFRMMGFDDGRNDFYGCERPTKQDNNSSTVNVSSSIAQAGEKPDFGDDTYTRMTFAGPI